MLIDVNNPVSLSLSLPSPLFIPFLLEFIDRRTHERRLRDEKFEGERVLRVLIYPTRLNAKRQARPRTWGIRCRT